MTMWTITADTTSSAAPWPREMNQNARVAMAWRAVKLRASTSRVAAPAKSPSGRRPYASGRWRTICASGTPMASTRRPEARAEAGGEPALHGAGDAALRARQGEGRRQDRLAPAEFLAQQHRVGAVGVEHERADQELDAEAGGDDPPAVEERAAGHARF